MGYSPAVRPSVWSIAARPGPAGALIALWGLLLAVAGLAADVDPITWYVFEIVDRIGADPWSLLQPIYNPPPMFTYAYRPLSTAGVKLLSALFGRDAGGLRLQGLVHGLVLIPYGLAAARALRAHGLAPAMALAAALLAMALPTVLFSAWTIPEFDAVGAAIALWAAAELRLGRTALALLPLALALLTKETTAALTLGWLLARGLQGLARGDRGPALLAAGFGLCLALAISPILSVPAGTTHPFAAADPRFHLGRVFWLGVHLGTQLAWSLGAGGALLLVAAAATASRRRGALRPLLLGLGLLSALGSPLLRANNHYESILITPWAWGGAWGLVALLALAALALGRASPDEKLIAGGVLIGVGGLLAGPIATSFSRADLSARLLAPALPWLLGLGLAGLQRAWRADGATRVALGWAVACLLWTTLGGAFSAVTLQRARFAAEAAGRAALVEGLQAGCPVVFAPHPDHELGPEELAALGRVPAEVMACLQVVRLDAVDLAAATLADDPDALRGYDQARRPWVPGSAGVEAALGGGPAPLRPVALFAQGPRWMGDPEDGQALRADLRWAVGRMPEILPGTPDLAEGAAFAADPALTRAFAQAAARSAVVSEPYLQLPIHLGELPHRLLRGLPVVEPWAYRVDVHALPVAAGGGP